MASNSNYYFDAMTSKLQEGTVKYGAGVIKPKRRNNIKNKAKRTEKKKKNIAKRTINNTENVLSNSK